LREKNLVEQKLEKATNFLKDNFFLNFNCYIKLWVRKMFLYVVLLDI
jgi:hypothetical protein